jgi:GNAT superfamily N-acetyltransferase
MSELRLEQVRPCVPRLAIRLSKPMMARGAVTVRWHGPEGYWTSDDPALIDVDLVHDWISRESYWAKDRPREVMARSIEHSLVLGLYTSEGKQVGFARFVTDRATFAWLCDVFVAAEHRGGGAGSFLVAMAVDHPDVAGIRQLLMANPGRSLYRRHGFDDLQNPERWMERPAPADPAACASVASG